MGDSLKMRNSAQGCGRCGTRGITLSRIIGRQYADFYALHDIWPCDFIAIQAFHGRVMIPL